MNTHLEEAMAECIIGLVPYILMKLLSTLLRFLIIFKASVSISEDVACTVLCFVFYGIIMEV